ISRVTLGGVSVDAETLSIPFRTFAGQLPRPTREQISWTADQNTLTARWSGFPSPQVMQYKWVLEGAPQPEMLGTSQSGEIVWNGLEAQRTYTLSVVSEGNSQYLPSDELRIKITTDKVGQRVRSDVMLAVASSASITASWSSIDSTTTYQVSLYLGEGEGERVGEKITTTDTMYAFSQLSSGTIYTIGIVAQSEGSTDSAEAFSTAMTEKFVLPSPTSQEITLLATANSVTVSWSDSANGANIYLLNIASDTESIGPQAVDTSANKHVFTKLSADTTYTVSVVSSRDETGYIKSPAYSETVITKPLLQLNAPVLNPPNAVGVSIMLSWSELALATTYEVNLYRGSNTEGEPLQSDNVLGTTHTFDMLDPITSYTLEVIAQAKNYRNSDPVTTLAMTLRQPLQAPSAQDLEATATTNSITITVRNALPAVEEYVLDISPVNSNQATQKLNASLGSQTILTELEPATTYTLTVISSADSTSYTNSVAYTTMIRTNYLGVLSTTTLTAFTENRRTNIRLGWRSVANAQTFRVKLYEGANNMDKEAPHVFERIVSASTLLIDEGVLDNAHYTAGVTALANDYSSSEETRMTARPRALQESSFDLERGTDSLNLSWRSDESSDSDFYSKTAFASLHISIEDLGGSVEIKEREVSTIANTYTAGSLDEGTAYILKVIPRVTRGDASVAAETLSITFKTLEKLPPPQKQHITWTAGQNTITVRWSAVPSGVTSYELTLSNETTRLEMVVDANTNSSATFNGLELQTAYTVSVVSSGERTSYLPSNSLDIEVMTDQANQLRRPDIMLAVESSVDIVVTWSEIESTTTYQVSLSLGDGRQGSIKSNDITIGTNHRFQNLSLATTYTVGVLAKSQGFIDSAEVDDTIVTEQFILPTPMSEGISLVATTNSVTVNWSGIVSEEVQTYLISLFPDRAKLGQRAIDASFNKHSFKMLLPNTTYRVSLVSSRDETGYVKSSPYIEMTQTQQLLKLGTPMLNFPTETNLSVVASWNEVANATTYTVNLYLASDASM
ncbi:MAG: fibronectin type III domain-containing protein, partial [Candidatus Oxydemutatoraceae bacterium WSBS_2016_MAG_OTU14]